MTYREEILQTLSDCYKDARGFRPSGDYLRTAAAMSDADLEALYARLCDEVEDSIAEDERAHAFAAERFEALINDLIATGAGDRETAIRWAMDAEGIDGGRGGYDVGFFEYLSGLKYGYIEQGQVRS